MRSKDPELMKQIQNYIHNYFEKFCTTPSNTEIANKFGIARGTAHKYLAAMDAAGMLHYREGKISDGTLELLVRNRKEAPLVGAVPCGDPLEEVENIEEIVSLPTNIFGDGPYYMLRAEGDSMTDEGIEEGDLLVILPKNTCNIGNIIVALDENGRNTLKKYGGIDSKTNDAILEYCNRSKYGDKVIRVKQLVCQGVLSHVIKNKL